MTEQQPKHSITMSAGVRELLDNDPEYQEWPNAYDLAWWAEQDLENRRREEMDMSQYAGSESKYLKASDLQGERPTVVISEVNLVEFDDDEKGKHKRPTLTFEGKEKQLVLNATNCEEIIRAFGPDSDSWRGQQVQLSSKYYKAFDREGIVLTPITGGADNSVPF